MEVVSIKMVNGNKKLDKTSKEEHRAGRELAGPES